MVCNGVAVNAPPTARFLRESSPVSLTSTLKESLYYALNSVLVLWKPKPRRKVFLNIIFFRIFLLIGTKGNTKFTFARRDQEGYHFSGQWVIILY